MPNERLSSKPRCPTCRLDMLQLSENRYACVMVKCPLNGAIWAKGWQGYLERVDQAED